MEAIFRLAACGVTFTGEMSQAKAQGLKTSTSGRAGFIHRARKGTFPVNSKSLLI